MIVAGVDGSASADWKPTVLIVEDEALLRETLCDHLRDCGFLVLEACDAQEAVEIIEACAAVDLVFTDVQMPGAMNGFGLAKWIRKNKPLLPVVVASGNSAKRDIAKELCAGEKFFAKPYDMNLVAGHLHESIAARRASR